MSDAEIDKIVLALADTGENRLALVRSVMAARDAQWREMLGEPVAWARAWHIAKETPKKERNANGNLAWPFKYKLLAVTPRKAMFDDSPLYAIKETP